MDTEHTITMLRRWRGKNGAVLALFPMIPGTYKIGEVTCYQHIGQHGSADLSHVVSGTVPVDADHADARELLAELRGIGYLPDVHKRAPAWSAILSAHRAALKDNG